MKQIEAIIFDMDGLLIDSEPFWRRAEIKVFAGVNVQLTEEDCIKTMGMRVNEVVQYWMERKPWTGTSQEEIAERIIDEVIRLIRHSGELMPGVGQTTAFFRSLGLPMAIASSSYQRIIDAVVEHCGLADEITLTHSAEFEPFGKPHPAVYLTACQKLGVAPEAALAFEDSPNGVRSALSAGMRCVFVPDKSLRAEAVESVSPTLRISSLEQFDKEAWNCLLHAAS